MQPSAFYADEEKTYASGFVYRVTTSEVSSLYSLNDDIDLSIAYTTPINAKYNQMNMGGWNNTSAATYVEKSLYFSKDYGSSGHSNVNQLNVRKDSFTQIGDTYICFMVNPSGYYYFGNAIDATETKGSLTSKLLTDFEINKIVFRMGLLTGWTKTEFEHFQSDGTLEDSDGHDIAFSDFIADPDDYVIRTFDVVALGYWDGSTWRSNNLSNSPNIKPVFMTKNAMTWGYLSLNKHLFDAASGTGSWGISNVSVYNSTSGNTTNINAWSRGAVYNGLSSAGYILGGINDHLEHKPDMTYTTMMDKCNNGVTGADTTLPAKEFFLADSILSYKYDQYTLANDSGSSGPSHFTRYNYYFCCGMKGEYLSTLLAHCGAYFYTGGSLTNLNDSGATPDNMAVAGMILGEMNAGGNTTGNWIGPDAMPAYTGPNKGGSIVHPGYNPSGGGGGGGYDDDPWHGISFSGVGVGGAGAFAKCYYMTSTELANLRSWMNSINVPEGFDPMQQIIGLSQVPVALSGSGPENVVFVNSSAVYDPGVTTRAVDTGVATQQAMGTPISYYLGSVDIVRRMQARGEPYLDYDCQIELYLPLIGMFSLDTQAVMGRTISAYAVLDPVSGTLAAYAYVSRDGQNLPIAYGSTTIGVDLPISAQQLSVSRAALKQANAQLGASLLSGALTMLAAASSGGKSSGSGAKTSTGSGGLSAAGIREAGSDYMKASQVGNVFGDFMQWGRTIRQLSYGNNTAIAGSFGGSTAQWAYPFTPYVKIIRPRYEKPSNYAHSQGVPCVQTKTIGNCTGFIQCIGADVSGITGATDLELQAIQAALSNGIYAGGGQ